MESLDIQRRDEMNKRLNINYDSDLIERISSDFDLRKPNKDGLRQLVSTLEGHYDPEVMQVLNLATGVGKTYLMAAFIEYLRCQGVSNVLVVTPGKVIQAKTVQNFAPGSNKYIEGSAAPPDIVTPDNYTEWVARSNGSNLFSFGQENPILLLTFNIHQLIAPTNQDGDTHGDTQDASRRRPRKFDENAGVLFDYLRDLDDLVVIADESHLYSESAAAFNSALKELEPAATIGLTASTMTDDHVIFTYPLYQAIEDKYVKAPVLAFRKDGYDRSRESEEQQLKDALQLREIKQSYYDEYIQQHNLNHLNAVVFVVCQDTDHATQVTELLRSPRFFNKKLAVLQVDSKHDDEVTNRLLNNLDKPDSPVRAVVSVNKLKEGWDVKNIAVIVTLRAMASEVLTEQTMGRGLRLPFGKYTGVLQIDQLDIIAHQSFKELLSAEKILQQFGLEEAVNEEQKNRLDRRIQSLEEDELNAEPELTVDDEDVSSEESPSVTIRPIPDSGFDANDLEIITIERNPQFAQVEYTFPVTRITEVQPDISVADIDIYMIERAAKRVTSTGDILIRKEIVASLGKGIGVQDTESAEIPSKLISEEDVKSALTRLVMNGQVIPVTEENKILIRDYLVKTFIEAADFDEWTVKSLASAEIELQKLVKDFANEVLRGKKEKTEIIPVKLPGTNVLHVPLGEKIHEPITSRSEFVRGRFYSGWFKSLFQTESFDSYTGEYLLAKLLNTSANIEWWHRLHSHDNAFIYYNAKDRYFPDFVAKDKDGVFWIIEGKNEAGKNDSIVQAKKKAAEAVVIRLIGQPDFKGQKWGYLIAYEDDVRSSDSWNDLKIKSQPIFFNNNSLN
jgi:type III restriction enzyme